VCACGPGLDAVHVVNPPLQSGPGPEPGQAGLHTSRLRRLFSRLHSLIPNGWMHADTLRPDRSIDREAVPFLTSCLHCSGRACIRIGDYKPDICMHVCTSRLIYIWLYMDVRTSYLSRYLPNRSCVCVWADGQGYTTGCNVIFFLSRML
jgi:hypothetical protein